MTASFPMYLRPENRAAYGRLWATIRDDLRAQGIESPEELTEADSLWDLWTDPDLLLSQSCALPWRMRLDGVATILGAPDYQLPGCPPGYYNSVFVLRADDNRISPSDWAGLRLAYNSPNSQSGYAAPQAFAASNGVTFTDLVATGSHRASATAVLENHADIACIDAQTWRMIARWDPKADQLQEAARTAPTPATPFITAASRDPEPIRSALALAISALPDADRALLDLHGLVEIPVDTYRATLLPPDPEAIPPATAARTG
ncbi:phosphate/phosphite/phosphonate ABC transporter substrate-binding protein [Aestuariibius sp. 2305UL40-4]|uniref:phosphate/phosphite/phosphonate ABC transporter substrate-binding protein n=1 Tax=Aestuariibius violaceus TaxID=3234132 RepID=UPI00345E8115